MIVIRRAFVCFLMVAFVFSGAAWAACIELPATPAAVTASHEHHAGAADHSDHRHIGGEQTAAAPDHGPVSDHDHAVVVKCCSLAPVVSLSPNLSASPVSFSGAVISFHITQRDLTGFVAALDPGIPKPIV